NFAYPSAFSVALGDVNGDGKPDLVATGSGVFDNSVSVRLGDGSGGFGPRTAYPTGQMPLSVAIADVSGDGNPDLATANYTDNTVSVLLGDGAGGFGPKTDFAAGSGPSSVAIGDLNADGKYDLAVANRSGGTFSWLYGTG